MTNLLKNLFNDHLKLQFTKYDLVIKVMLREAHLIH